LSEECGENEEERTQESAKKKALPMLMPMLMADVEKKDQNSNFSKKKTRERISSHTFKDTDKKRARYGSTRKS